MNIRLLQGSDAVPYKELRIQAVSEWPPAFGVIPEEEEAKEITSIARSLEHSENRSFWGAFSSGALIGILRYSRYSGENEGHRAYIAGLYVAPECRGQGVGRSLVEYAIREARNDPRIRRLNLTVVSGQAAARRLYESLGFEECGIDFEAFEARGSYFNEIMMTLPIGSGKSNNSAHDPNGTDLRG